MLLWCCFPPLLLLSFVFVSFIEGKIGLVAHLKAHLTILDFNSLLPQTPKSCHHHSLHHMHLPRHHTLPVSVTKRRRGKMMVITSDYFWWCLVMLARLKLLTSPVVRNRKWVDVTNPTMTQRLFILCVSVLFLLTRTCKLWICDIETIWFSCLMMPCTWCHYFSDIRLRSEVRSFTCVKPLLLSWTRIITWLLSLIDDYLMSGDMKHQWVYNKKHFSLLSAEYEYLCCQLHQTNMA